jgi:hypothetical protein
LSRRRARVAAVLAEPGELVLLVGHARGFVEVVEGELREHPLGRHPLAVAPAHRPACTSPERSSLALFITSLIEPKVK